MLQPILKHSVKILLSLVLLFYSGIQVYAQDERLDTDQKDFQIATVDQEINYDIVDQVPPNLLEDLKKGGYVIVFRYTGAGGEFSEVPNYLTNQVKDDGQRMSQESQEKMAKYRLQFEALSIPVRRVLVSEYYFVWQHAQAAFGDPLIINRDLTGSLDFQDPNELAESLQNLRNRVVTSPEEGTNTVLFTHQGKFDKALGYYIPAGTSLLFKPDGTGHPNLVAILSLDQFLQLGQ